MKKNNFNIRWLRVHAKSDPEIRALVRELDTEVSQLHRFGGFDLILDELHRIQSEAGFVLFLKNAYRKFLYLKKYGHTA